MKASSKPVRVLEQQISLGQCPACQLSIEGTLQVEVHLGTPTIVVGERDEETNALKVSAVAPTTTHLRGLDVRHRCSDVVKS